MSSLIKQTAHLFSLALVLTALACLFVAPAYAVAECSTPSFNVAPTFSTNNNPSSNVLGGANVAVGDFNSDGALDLVVANFNSDTFSLLAGDGEGGFAPPQSFPVGIKNGVDGQSHPRNVAVGEFNGDSKLDVVVVGGNTSNTGWVSVLLGNGAGGFGPANNITTGASAEVPAVGDFNGDGKKDIAVATAASAKVSILLGNGAGGFTLAGNVVMPADTTNAITVADFNGDSVADIAVTGSGAAANWHFSIILGNTAGSFTVNRTVPVRWTPLAITSGDFNNDGKADLAVTITFSSPNHYVVIMLGDGTGNFGPATEIFTGYEPMSVVTSDFNKDSKTDVAVIASSSNSVAILLGDGAGNFSSPKYFGTHVSPGSLAVGDFNKDGAPDLVVRHPRSDIVSILLGDGSGSFASSTTELTGGSKVASADFNGDGIADLAITNNATFSPAAIEIRYGNGIGGLNPPVRYPVAQYPLFIALADFNSDGRLDIAVGHEPFNGRFISILYADTGGGFSNGPFTYAAPNSSGFITAGDFNGDAKPDLVYLSNNSAGNVALMLNNGAGGFAQPSYFASGGIATSFATGDFNHDGKRDLAVTSSNSVTILIGDGTGNLTVAPYPPAPVASNTNYVTVADINKDGVDDLVTGGSDVNSVSILINNGAGFAPFISPGATGSSNSIKVADFNMDGNPDLAIGVGGFAGNILILTGDGTGNFSGPFYFVAGGGTADIVVADFNRDGKPDLAATGGVITSTNTTILLNTFTIQPCLSVTSENATEGDTGVTEAVFTVSLSSDSAQAVKVNYLTKSHTATSGLDYQHVSGRLSFAPGVTTQTVRVPINGDTLDEFDEDFYLLLSNPINAAISTGQGVGNIIDNDPEPAISIGDVMTLENNPSFTAAFDVTLSAPSSKPVGFAYSTADGTATSAIGGDYFSVSNTQMFPTGETRVRVFVSIRNDNTFEPDETFFVNLSSPLNATIAKGQGTGTIINDDTPTLRLGQSSYNIGEGAGSLAILVNRSGDPSLPVTVNYSTADAAAFLQNCNVTNGAATSRCDYVGVLGTLHFAANETSKTISIPIVDDTYAEGTESFSISLSNPTGGAVIGTVQTAPIQITDNGNDSSGQSNPIDSQSFFVRQHYIDFLSREPDPLSAGWITILNQCGAGDQSCRLTVSQGIYGSPEFRDRGYFIYKFYSVSLGRKPSYDEFNLDRARVSGFQTEAELEQSKVDFIADFMSRAEFTSIYNGLSNNAYVQQLFTTAGVTQITVGGVVRTLSTEQQLLAGGRTRAQVLRDVAESPEVSSRFQTESTVVMHYFGYLRRDPDAAYQGWINILNSAGDSRNVTSGFINSAEYRARFGQ